jgi:hypothetical protein
LTFFCFHPSSWTNCKDHPRLVVMSTSSWTHQALAVSYHLWSFAADPARRLNALSFPQRSLDSFPAYSWPLRFPNPISTAYHAWLLSWFLCPQQLRLPLSLFLQNCSS